MQTALLAGAAMVAANILAVIVVQCEAANRGWMAGSIYCLAWYVGIFTTTLSVTTLQGHNTDQKILVLALVGLANLLGTKSGQVLGKRLLHRLAAPTPLEDAVSRLIMVHQTHEARLRALEVTERGQR